MRIFALAFLLGILLLQQFSILPSSKWVWIICVATLSISLLKKFHPFTGIAFGFAWCLWFAHLQTSWILPDNLQGKTIKATGYIASIPETDHAISSFQFSLKKFQTENSTQPTHGRVKLSWRQKYSTPEKPLHVGDKWQFTLRLKKIYGTMNPGGFDYEAWALQEGIRANGYIVESKENHLLSSHWYSHPLDRMREFLKNKIENNLPLSNTSAWITALTVGERHGIAPESWEILRNTGTNHLMAIAGLHIGFMSGFAFAFITWIWRRSQKLMLLIPAQHAGAIAALLMALIYSALAGFSIPTQRACIMLTVFLCFQLGRRHAASWLAWSIALILVLLINPLTVLTDSFWLSFGAVALIIYGVSGRLSPKGLWWKWGRLQWVIGFGLIPFSIWLFQQCSIISFVANSIAIPWVGFLVVPLSLIGSFILLFSAKLGSLILLLADKTLSLLWIILTWLAHLSWASWYQVMPNFFILLISCIGIIILLIPSGMPGRLLGFIWLLPLCFYQPPKPLKGDAWLTLLDVGQGLATVIQTHNHILVFDTGAKLSPSFDMGESVVVPYLRTLKTKNLDMLIISHGDNDHIGGSDAIRKRFHVLSIKTSVPEKLPSSNTSYCLRGEHWNWDGVEFKFLYPTPENLGLNNDSSCVLRITAQNKNILLTGDIEKYAEKYLVENELEDLPSTILVAPHHGSKTSGVDEFLFAVKPQYVLFPYGYRNRYHFPHETVIAKYDNLSAIKYDSVKSGAINLKLSTDKIEVRGYRLEHHRYWNNYS